MTGTGTSAYRWSRIGGHPALDLCNTVSWRLDPARTIERLATGTDLVNWFRTVVAPAGDRPPHERGVLDRSEAADRALDAVRDLRSSTIRVIDAHLAGEPAASADVTQISTAWRRALAVATTRPQLPWQWVVEPGDPTRVLHVLALSVADLLHRPDQSDLRRCDGEGCGWLFLDSSRNHSRRWCDPLDCGNRARVRSYSRRHRTPDRSLRVPGTSGEQSAPADGPDR
jgi:predicted RNA-binding Zn ribbon-like protein